MKKFEQIIRRIVPQGELLRTWQLHGGISAQMTALEIRLPDGQTAKMVVRQISEVTLKRNPQAAGDEFRLLEVLQAAGLPVPKPYAVHEAGEIFDTPYLVVEYIDGQPDYNPQNVRDFSQQAAAQLAQIHQVRHPALALLPKRAIRFADSLAQDLLRLDPGLTPQQIQQITAAAGQLSTRNEAVLIHGDFWAGNLLWRDEQLLAVIDWEDAHLGDPLMDFAISQLDMLMLFGEAAMEVFTAHYRAAMTHLDFSQLPYLELYAALRAAPNLTAWAAVNTQLMGRADFTEQTMRERHEWFVAPLLAKLGRS